MGMRLENGGYGTKKELSQEEKEQITQVWNNIKEAVTRVAKNVISVFKKLVEAVRKWRKQVDEEAAAGNPKAQYVKYTLEIMYYQRKLEEVDALLKVTKKTTARKPLLERRKHYQENLNYYKQRQQYLLEGSDE